MKIPDEILSILRRSQIEGCNLALPPALDRKTYQAVNKVIEALGGKWNRKAKAHVFPDDPLTIIQKTIEKGAYTDRQKEYGYFPTPIPLAQRMVELAGIQPGETVLEPSAGSGNIAGVIGRDCVHCVEIQPDLRNSLIEAGFLVVGSNFLEFDFRYDVIIANPPFANQADIDHVTRMIALARRRVVAVMSAGVLFRENREAAMFREKVEAMGGEFQELPERAFAESGTLVRTCLLTLTFYS